MKYQVLFSLKKKQQKNRKKNKYLMLSAAVAIGTQNIAYCH